MTTTLERVDKPARLLIAGRLTVVRVDGDYVDAQCKGDSGELYQLGYYPKVGKWLCTCEARTACSHLKALWRVAVRA